MEKLTNLEREAQQLGFPATLFGFTPNERAYWIEPGLPWFTSKLRENPPLGYTGLSIVPHITYLDTDSMAPRFPRHCGVCLMPLHKRENLAVGRVYVWRYYDAASGEYKLNIGRLTAIGGNYLEVAADNHPTLSIWPLRAESGKEVWDVLEVSYYVSYPEL